MRRISIALAAAAFVSAAPGCGDDGAGESTATVSTVSPTHGDETPSTTDPHTSTSGAPTSSASSPPASTQATGDEAIAVADLAERRGVDPAEIVTVSVENVTWRNSAVGCPQQGFEYMQVLTDGVRVVLEHGGQRFHYHAGGGRPVFYCANPEPPVGE